MNHPSQGTIKNLDTCDWRMQEIHYKGMPNAPHDYAVICGSRPDEDQQEAFDKGLSDAKPGESAHNITKEDGSPNSGATDIQIYHDGKYRWPSESPEVKIMYIENMRYLQGVAVGLGHRLAVMPTLKDGTEDLGHCELVA